jgi:hypothetical protein
VDIVSLFEKMDGEGVVEGMRGNLIDIIYDREVLVDMLLYFILYTGIALIMSLRK